MIGKPGLQYLQSARRTLMIRSITSLVLICASLQLAPLPASALTIDTVPVGNPGNAGEVQIQGTFGNVAYHYRIGATEVTNAQYAAFLNAKAASDPLGLYNPSMHFNPNIGIFGGGGITRSGSSGNFSYAVKTDMGGKPVNYVSWYDSIRFVNWLNNGQGTGDTETGAYTILGGTPTPSNGASIIRNAGAIWFLPTENEWYKAAYYEPAAQGGDVDNYWLYPTASNSEPAIATANGMGDISNPGENVVNYAGGADWDGQDGNLTTVASAGTFSQSFYGTSDQAGNVYEWNESLGFGSFRGMRGGAFEDTLDSLKASYRFDIHAVYEDYFFGFRVASVPEPSTLALAALGILGLLIAARRKR